MLMICDKCRIKYAALTLHIPCYVIGPSQCLVCFSGIWNSNKAFYVSNDEYQRIVRLRREETEGN